MVPRRGQCHGSLEAVAVNVKDVRLEPPAQVRIFGKGRKERTCPLWQETVNALRAYLQQRDKGNQPDAPLFLNAHQKRLTADSTAILSHLILIHISLMSG